MSVGQNLKCERRKESLILREEEEPDPAEQSQLPYLRSCEHWLIPFPESWWLHFLRARGGERSSKIALHVALFACGEVLLLQYHSRRLLCLPLGSLIVYTESSCIKTCFAFILADNSGRSACQSLVPFFNRTTQVCTLHVQPNEG